MQILMGLVGMVALLAIALLLSSNRKAINIRTVLGAWLIQVGIGALILYVPAGRQLLLAMSQGVANVIAYGNEGIGFLFGGPGFGQDVRSLRRRRLCFSPFGSCR
jgi:Nucleoside permease